MQQRLSLRPNTVGLPARVRAESATTDLRERLTVRWTLWQLFAARPRNVGGGSDITGYSVTGSASRGDRRLRRRQGWTSGPARSWSVCILPRSPTRGESSRRRRARPSRSLYGGCTRLPRGWRCWCRTRWGGPGRTLALARHRAHHDPSRPGGERETLGLAPGGLCRSDQGRSPLRRGSALAGGSRRSRWTLPDRRRLPAVCCQQQTDWPKPARARRP